MPIQLPQFPHWLTPSHVNMDNNTHGQLEQAVNYPRDTSSQNERKPSAVAVQSSPLWTHHFVPCLTSLLDWSSNSSQLLALTILLQGMSIISCPSWDQPPLTVSWFWSIKTLQVFFTSIDQDRFVRSWFMLLDFLRPKMNVSDQEVFSVYPGKSNNPGDIIKGRTFRRLNVTRKIVIQDVPDLIKSALDMQTFALGHKCILQKRGSPMGSPLSPALCLMVVSISEQIWSINFHQLLSNHSLFIRHIRYVDNRLIFGDKRLLDLAPYEVLLDDGFYGKPIILETEPDQEFLGFMLETQPLELIYQGPTNISQVLSPFSASPPKVLLSGFRSRCHIVIKGAFPQLRVLQGLDQLIRLYTTAGFPKEDLQAISDQLLMQHTTCDVKKVWCAACLTCSELFLLSC